MSQLVHESSKKIIANIEKVIVGKRKQLILSLVSWFSGGHLLLEDVPGVAKTMLARALAASVGCTFKRVQCTPDLLPSDITGASIFNQQKCEFEFRPGPLFTNILLADEINRTTPRAQSALLEAMAESCATIDGITHQLPNPFLVIATQNPIDHEGTFPLPEAQLDRFFMKLSLGYPSLDEELKLLQLLEREHPIQSLGSVVSAEEIKQVQSLVKQVYVDPKVRQYMLQIIHETRAHSDLALGAGPRATIAVFRASQAMAAIRGRPFVQPDDVKKILTPVMAHRLILRPESRLRRMTGDQILDSIVAEIAVPTLEENRT